MDLLTTSLDSRPRELGVSVVVIAGHSSVCRQSLVTVGRRLRRRVKALAKNGLGQSLK